MATLILDNGASTAKIGFSEEGVSILPNCQFRSRTARLKTFTSNQIDEIKDPSGLYYILPFQKGYLVNWDVQRQVWDHLFGKEMYKGHFNIYCMTTCNCFEHGPMTWKSGNAQYIGLYARECISIKGKLGKANFSTGSGLLMGEGKHHGIGKVDFPESTIIITEPYFNFNSIQESMNEILFEEYQFQAVYRTNAGTLSASKYFEENDSELCCLVVDSGYSFTHIVPYCKRKKMNEGICSQQIYFNGRHYTFDGVTYTVTGWSNSKDGTLLGLCNDLRIYKALLQRINVGGKLLSNHLKEIISYRQLHVMDETHVINQVKEDVCYVSQDFYKDMEIAQLKGEANTVMRDYVLPDFSTIKKGFCKPLEEMVFSGKYKTSEQILRLTNERFAVPEILFHPSDIGIQEMGIPEAIVHSVQSLPEEMHPHFYKNIVLTGGNSLLPGFRDRVYAEVRSLTPCDYDVSVLLPENPITYSWEGGKLLSEHVDFMDMVVTRDDYEENGHCICEEKFDI